MLTPKVPGRPWAFYASVLQVAWTGRSSLRKIGSTWIRSKERKDQIENKNYNRIGASQRARKHRPRRLLYPA